MVFSDFNPLGPKLKAQTPPKYALTAPTTSTQGYAVREKMLSISGEDFYVEREGGGRVFDIVGSNKVPFGVGGFVLDKMELKASGKLCGSIERRAGLRHQGEQQGAIRRRRLRARQDGTEG